MGKSLSNFAKNHLTDRNDIWLILKIIVVMASTIAVFYNDLAMVLSDAQMKRFPISLQYFIFIYLLYRKRKAVIAATSVEDKNQHITGKLETIAGILLIITATLLYWYGSSLLFLRISYGHFTNFFGRFNPVIFQL